MSQWSPIKRRNFVKRLRVLGFEGPYAGSRHLFMLFERHRLAIPSNAEYSVPQLRMMIKEVDSILGRRITVDEWNKLQ